jgi:hypothetical protein
MALEELYRASHGSRRSFLEATLLAGAAATLLQARAFLGSRGWLEAAQAATLDLTHDTFSGLLAFVVPGSDTYSVAQGLSTTEPGGVDAGATEVLITTVDESTPLSRAFQLRWRPF